MTVADAMWKGAAVIGGKVGGIPYQIQDGKNGFLVSSVDETARRIVELIKDKGLREQMGNAAKDTIKKNFLMIRYLEQCFDLFNSFETSYKLHYPPAS